jgi:hypothetical protein
MLRPPQLTDPPLLVTLPLLMSESFAAEKKQIESSRLKSPANSAIGEIASSAGA